MIDSVDTNLIRYRIDNKYESKIITMRTTLIDRMYSPYVEMLYEAQTEYPATMTEVINTLSTNYYVRDLTFGIIFDLQTMTRIGNAHPYDMFEQM